MEKKTALVNTMFDQKDDPESLADAIAQAVNLIASYIAHLNNLQSVGISMLTAALTLVADTVIAMYREDEWTWTGAQK